MTAKIVSIAHLASHVGEEVTLRGWLYNRRSSGKLHFLEVRDGSSIVQAVAVKGEVPDALFEKLGALPQESALIVSGPVRAAPRTALGVEIGIESAEIVSEAEPY